MYLRYVEEVCVGWGWESSKEKKGRNVLGGGGWGSGKQGAELGERGVEKDGFFSHVKLMVPLQASIFLKMVFLGLCLSQGSPNLLTGLKARCLPPPGLQPWAGGQYVLGTAVRLTQCLAQKASGNCSSYY